MEIDLNTNHARRWNESAPHKQPVERKVIRVKKQSWITKGEKILYSLVGSLLVASSLYMVSFSSTTDSLNREIQTLESQVQHQKIENEGLAFEIKELSKPERITKIAKENGLKIKDAEVRQAKVLNN